MTPHEAREVFAEIVDAIRVGWGSGSAIGREQASSHVDEIVGHLDLSETRLLIAYAAAYVAGREHADMPTEGTP